MQTAQAWFAGGPSGSELQKPSSSLLSEWNSYTASRSAEDGGSSALGFDIEAAVRTANDKVSGTFSVVSKSVREIPGSFQNATSSVPSGKALMYFGLLLASGVFFIFIAFTMFLPVMVLVPQKFAICFTLGCGFIVGSFFALKGPKNQLLHMFSKELMQLLSISVYVLVKQNSGIYVLLLIWQICPFYAMHSLVVGIDWRLPFTLGFIGSMVGTIYVSMVQHSYLLSVFFSVIQVMALAYYVVSYFPGGSTGMKFLASTLMSSILKCFGR